MANVPETDSDESPVTLNVEGVGSCTLPSQPSPNESNKLTVIVPSSRQSENSPAPPL